MSNDLNSGTISALAAIFGSLASALASSVSSWITQKRQDHRQRRWRENLKRILSVARADLDQDRTKVGGANRSGWRRAECSMLAIGECKLSNRQQRISSSGIRNYYYIFMTAARWLWTPYREGLSLNNFRTIDFPFPSPRIRAIAECST